MANGCEVRSGLGGFIFAQLGPFRAAVRAPTLDRSRIRRGIDRNGTGVRKAKPTDFRRPRDDRAPRAGYGAVGAGRSTHVRQASRAGWSAPAATAPPSPPSPRAPRADTGPRASEPQTGRGRGWCPRARPQGPGHRTTVRATTPILQETSPSAFRPAHWDSAMQM